MPAKFDYAEQEVFVSILRGLRAERKLKQIDIARKMNVSQQTIARYESGDRRMDLGELWHWCQALGVEFEEVVERFLAAVRKTG